MVIYSSYYIILYFNLFREVVMIIRMSSLSLARHDLVVQRHDHSHVGIVFFGGLPKWVLSLIKSVSLVEE